MDSRDFDELMRSWFVPFLGDLGFRLQDLHLSGRYYRATFAGDFHMLTVSFEPGDNYTSAVLFNKGDESRAAMDVPTRSFHPAQLNARYLGQVTAAERQENNVFFGSAAHTDMAERELISMAEDLRLVLPYHLGLREKHQERAGTAVNRVSNP